MSKWLTGGCHCQNVQFRCWPESNIIYDCNCSICTKKGFLHLIVGRDQFELLTPKENLGLYQFGTKTAKHYFCKTCGISSFYIPRSHPDSYSVNVRCLENVSLEDFKIKNFDGQNWEDNIQEISD